MRHSLVLSCLIVMAMLSGCATVAHREIEVVDVDGCGDVSIYYENLKPYGEWVADDSWGLVWIPYGVPIGWRPYTHGHWLWTDWGWHWSSHHKWGPWGDVPFHYGRWYPHHRHGWAWVPGSIWSPAWVAWRRGDGCIGWAALPPPVSSHRAIRRSHSAAESPDPSAWSFVHERRLANDDIDRSFEPFEKVDHLLGTTKDETAYDLVDGRVINRSLSLESIATVLDRKPERTKVADVRNPVREVRRVDRNSGVFRSIDPKIVENLHRSAQPPSPLRSRVELNDAQLRQDPSRNAAVQRTQNEETRRLDVMHDDMRRQLETRQQSERARLTTGTSSVPLEQQQSRERQILESRIAQETRLMLDQQHRELESKGRRTSTSSRRFDVSTTTPRTRRNE